MKIYQDNELYSLCTSSDLETVMVVNRQLGNRPQNSFTEVNKAVKSSFADLRTKVKSVEQKVNNKRTYLNLPKHKIRRSTAGLQDCSL